MRTHVRRYYDSLGRLKGRSISYEYERARAPKPAKTAVGKFFRFIQTVFATIFVIYLLGIVLNGHS